MKKKKICFVILGLFVLFCCSACKGNITRDIRHAGFSVGGTFNCSRFYPKDDEDVAYEKIMYFTGNHVINTNGKIYELSLGQKYANNENCKEADTGLTVKAIYDNKIIKATDNKYYYLESSNNVSSYSNVPVTDNSYGIYDLLLKENDVVKAVTADSSSGLYYVLKSDGNIYSYTISRQSHNDPLYITSIMIVYDKNDYGSRIIDFGYAGDSLNTFIRTEEKIYRMRIMNSDVCGKYADVKCEYQLVEDEIFNTYKDVIISFNGSSLITNYKQIFNVAS